MDLDTAIDELYGLDPADFTARRDAISGEVRRAGDRPLAAAIKGLRRPSAAAFAVNLMARSRPDELARLTELGGRLREAQAALSGDELRALGRQRQQVIAGLVRETRRLAGEAGHRLSDQVQREIEATFEAALADEAAGQALSLGRLVRALERSGMDPVDLEGAVAGSLPPSGPPGPGVSGRSDPTGTGGRSKAATEPERAAATDPERAAARAQVAAAAREAELAAEQAEGRLRTAVERHERAQRHREDAGEEVGRRRAEVAAAEDEVRRRRAELAAAEERAERAIEDERAARRTRLEAEEEAETAAAAARRARVRADSTGG